MTNAIWRITVLLLWFVVGSRRWSISDDPHMAPAAPNTSKVNFAAIKYIYDAIERPLVSSLSFVPPIVLQTHQGTHATMKPKPKSKSGTASWWTLASTLMTAIDENFMRSFSSQRRSNGRRGFTLVRWSKRNAKMYSIHEYLRDWSIGTIQSGESHDAEIMNVFGFPPRRWV